MGTRALQTLALSVALCLSAPVVTQAQDTRLTDVLLASYVVAGFTDTAQTAYCLGAQTCREANPALRWAIAQRGVPAAMTAKGAWHVGISYLLYRQHHRHPRAVRWVAGILTAAQLAVVISNARIRATP